MNFEKKLKALRLSHELSQTDMADRLCMTQSNYNKYENGKLQPSDDIVKRVAEEFNLSEEELTGESLNLKDGKSQHKPQVNYYSIPENIIDLLVEQNKIMGKILHAFTSGQQ